MNHSPDSLPDLTNPSWATAGLERLDHAGLNPARLPPETRRALHRTLGASPAVAGWILQDPGLLEVFGSPDLHEELGRAEFLVRLSGWREVPGRDAFFRYLRRARNREMVRITAREALRLAPIETTAREISSCAEAFVEVALVWSLRDTEERHGPVLGEDGRPNLPCVLGMGKLGGSELNLCSDVDLLVLYRAAQGSARDGLNPQAFHARVVSLLSETLGKLTPDGFVFRVDLDLRPEGRSGPLAQPLENALLYYESWGQTWERGALLRARPVAGDLELGWAFLRRAEPFVYRRSLDYTTVEDFHEMKRRIDRHEARSARGEEDLKLGRGGIRELEFFVQTLQLIHGGRIPRVRERNTLGALQALQDAGLVEASRGRGLARCYRLLRRVEHAVQALHFVRTHRIPRDPEELQTVAELLGFAGTDDFRAALADVREEVHGAFDELFRGPGVGRGEEPGTERARALLALRTEDASAPATLRRAGFRDPARALDAIALLREGPPRGPSPRARRILDRLAPLLLSAASSAPDPDRALLHLGEFLASSGARTGYLSLLEQNPPTARLLVTLFGTSGFLSRYLIGHPELLDELVLGSAAVPEKSAEGLRQELTAAADACSDEEEHLEVLRRFRNAEFLRVALNDLWGTLGPDDVGRQLSLVAEACLEEAVRSSRARLSAKHGEPGREDGGPAPFAVLALGKLGGRELDYHSDLDVVFLYEDAAPERPDPAGALSRPEFFARLAQRVIGTLSSRTREGVAFRIDARLRPSGRAGPLVTSLGAFRRYHQVGGSQWWEKQALVKLRPVAGDRELGEAALAFARQALFGGPPSEDPRPEISRMRRRIEREVAREGEGRVDLKAGPGGLMDVEFAVQALQLLHGWRFPEARCQNTMEALEGLRRSGIVDDEEGVTLAQGYAFLRRLEANLRILQERPTDLLPAESARLTEVAGSMGIGGADGGEGLLARVVETRASVRRVYAKMLGIRKEAP